MTDLSRYGIGLRQETRVDVSGHVYFESDQAAWRLIERVDGQPLDDDKTTMPDGTELSATVVLTTET